MITAILFTLLIHAPTHKQTQPVHREHLYYDTTEPEAVSRKNRRQRRIDRSRRNK